MDIFTFREYRLIFPFLRATYRHMNGKQETIERINAVLMKDNPKELNLYILMLEHLAKEGLLNAFDVYDVITALRKEMGMEDIAFEAKEPVQTEDNKSDEEKRKKSPRG